MVCSAQKRKGGQGDCPGRHWGHWSLPLTPPVMIRAVILTTFPLLWDNGLVPNSHYLKQWWPSHMTHICVPWPRHGLYVRRQHQLVNISKINLTPNHPSRHSEAWGTKYGRAFGKNLKFVVSSLIWDETSTASNTSTRLFLKNIHSSVLKEMLSPVHFRCWIYRQNCLYYRKIELGVGGWRVGGVMTFRRQDLRGIQYTSTRFQRQ